MLLRSYQTSCTLCYDSIDFYNFLIVTYLGDLMHIPDGYLGPITYGIMWIVMIPIWFYAGNWLKKNLKDRQVPYLALAAAFSFVIMMFNVPIVGGSTGHAVGSALIAIIFRALGSGCNGFRGASHTSFAFR